MMTTVTIDIFFLLLLLFFFLFPILNTAEECRISSCGNESFPIRFPFQLQDQQPQNCGYPGFQLLCNNQNITVLRLPFSGEFFVRQISYITQEILLYDPDFCLPRRLLTFNLSNSPFVSAFYQNYTFLSCPSSFMKPHFTSIDCLSNSTHSVLATSSTSLATSMSSSCQIMSTLAIPVSRPVPYDEGVSSSLDNDLHLTWYVPDCSSCEEQGSMCRFRTNTSQEIGCFYNPEKDGTNDGLRIFRIMCLAIAVPAITCAAAIACYACMVDRANYRAARRSPTAVAAAPPEPAIVMGGLDDTTIESYQKLVLGESRRLPGPNDTTCPICLSEYCTKETLRCIPECKHCFHAECIDEWLRLNGTCPVCRNSPSPAHVSSDTV